MLLLMGTNNMQLHFTETVVKIYVSLFITIMSQPPHNIHSSDVW